MPFESTLRGRRSRLRPDANRAELHKPARHLVTPVVPRPSAATAPAPAAAKSKTRRLGRRPILDGLRGLAVLLVICEHTGLIDNGFMGVDVFFVLSGFLITTLLCEEWDRFGRISLKGFYTRRARRLLPALGVLALMAVAADLFAYRLTGWGLGLKLATTFGFMNNWVAGLSLDHGSALGALNPTWSLAQEDQFYLAWPLALIAMLKFGVKPGQILLLLVGAIAAILLLEPTVAPHLAGYQDYYDPIDRAAELLLGCAGSLLWRNRMVPLPDASMPEQRLRRSVQLAVELSLAGLTFAFTWLLLKTNPADSRWVFMGAAGITLPALLILIQVPRTLIGRLIASAPLRIVGRLSYGLYLIHLLTRNLLLHYVPGLSDQPLATFALTVSVSLLLAALSYRYIESPVLRGRWPVPLAWLARALRGALARGALLTRGAVTRGGVTRDTVTRDGVTASAKPVPAQRPGIAPQGRAAHDAGQARKQPRNTPASHARRSPIRSTA